jgi:hypothetical protein
MPSKKTLDEALHVRLLIDNPKRLKFMDWVDGDWRQADLGLFYPDDDVVGTAIVDITQLVLADEGRKLPKNVANSLHDDVVRTTKPPAAVERMAKATQDAVPI